MPEKACPFCGSGDTAKENDFSTSLMVARYYCRACRSHFEVIKWGDRTDRLDLPDFLESTRND